MIDETRILHSLETGERHLIWPLDTEADRFSRSNGEEAYTTLRRDGKAGVVLPDGEWVRYLLSERFDLERRLVVEGDEKQQSLRSVVRTRFDVRKYRTMMYRFLTGGGRSAGIEARIGPAEEIAAGIASVPLFHVQNTTGRKGFLAALPNDSSEPDISGVAGWVRLLGGSTEDLPTVIRPVTDRRPTGIRSVLDLRGEAVRLIFPAGWFESFVPSDAFDTGVMTDSAEWWGLSLLILTMETVRLLHQASGMVQLVLSAPQSSVQKNAAPAIQFLAGLSGAGTMEIRAMVDHCYRRQSDVDALRELFPAFPPSWRAVVQGAIGNRRWEHFLSPRSGTFLHHRASRGDTVALAADRIVESLTSRLRRRGDAFPAALDRRIKRSYLDPLSRSGVTALRKRRESGELGSALQAASLSRLRRVLRMTPRSILVDAAVFESRDVKMRISTIFSRRGRRMFFEDLEARESAIQRETRFDYRVILSARLRVLAIAKRVAL